MLRGIHLLISGDSQTAGLRKFQKEAVMRKVLTTLVAVLLVCGLALAHEKKEKKAREQKVSGDILAIDEAKSTITLTKANVMSTVTFNASTRWTKQEGGKVVDAKRDEFKVGSRVICMVTVDDKGKMIARRIDLRRPR